MACPLFLPSSPLAGAASGDCSVQPGIPIPADLLRCCNTGYARSCCPNAVQSDADAFRFLIKSNRCGVVEVGWSSERNHHPVAVGTLLVSGSAVDESPLERQARACAEEYFR